MKKFFIFIALIFIFTWFVYWNINLLDYKKNLQDELLKEMNIKLDELIIKKQIKEEEIIPKLKNELIELRNTYNENDFEYDIIQELINNLDLKKQKEKQENSQEQNKNQEEGKQEQEQIIPKWDSINIDENSQDAKNKLSKEEKQEIENYLKWLQEEEKQNIRLNKPKDEKTIFDIFSEDFFFKWFDNFFFEWFDRNENDW